MEIRPMMAADVDEVSRLYVRSWQAGYKGLLPHDYLDSLSCERWQIAFSGQSGSFVLTEGGVIAGHSNARPAADPKMPGWERCKRCMSSPNTGAGASALRCWTIPFNG